MLRAKPTMTVTVDVNSLTPTEAAALFDVVAHVVRFGGGEATLTEAGQRVRNQLRKRGWKTA